MTIPLFCFIISFSSVQEMLCWCIVNKIVSLVVNWCKWNRVKALFHILELGSYSKTLSTLICVVTYVVTTYRAYMYIPLGLYASINPNIVTIIYDHSNWLAIYKCSKVAKQHTFFSIDSNLYLTTMHVLINGPQN